MLPSLVRAAEIFCISRPSTDCCAVEAEDGLLAAWFYQMNLAWYFSLHVLTSKLFQRVTTNKTTL